MIPRPQQYTLLPGRPGVTCAERTASQLAGLTLLLVNTRAGSTVALVWYDEADPVEINDDPHDVAERRVARMLRYAEIRAGKCGAAVEPRRAA